MILNIDFGIRVHDDSLLIDNLCLSASRGVMGLIKESSICNGEQAPIEILTFDNVFHELTANYRYIEISMRIVKYDEKFGDTEDIMDTMFAEVTEHMATELGVSTDVFSHGPSGISGGSSDSPVGIWKEGTVWLDEDFKWNASDSNDAVSRVDAGEDKTAVIADIDMKKREKMNDRTRVNSLPHSKILEAVEYIENDTKKKGFFSRIANK